MSTSTPSDLPPEIAFAVARSVSQRTLDRLRADLDTGIYPIDTMVRIQGTLTVDPNHTVKSDLDSMLLIAEVLSSFRMFVSQDAINSLVVKAAERLAEHMGDPAYVERLQVDADRLRASFEQADSIVSQSLPKRERRGAIHADLDVSLLPVTD